MGQLADEGANLLLIGANGVLAKEIEEAFAVGLEAGLVQASFIGGYASLGGVSSGCRQDERESHPAHDIGAYARETAGFYPLRVM